MELAEVLHLLKYNEGKLHSLITKAHGWFVEEDFHLLAKWERCRSERNQHTSFHVVIDLSEHFREPGLVCKDKYQWFLSHLVAVITDNTREIDLKCLSEDYRVFILLMDTSPEGAKAVVEKIFRKLYRYFSDQCKLEYLTLLKTISFSTVPLTQPEHNFRFEGILLAEGVSHPAAAAGASGNDSPASAGSGNSIPFTHSQNPSPVLAEEDNFYFNWKIFSLSQEPEPLGAPAPSEADFPDNLPFAYPFLKRVMDLTAAGSGTLLFLPVILVIALLIKLTSRGPVLFRQKRVGYRGKLFTCYKFRTMRVNADDCIHREYIQKLIEGKNEEVNTGNANDPVYKLKDDPRITAVGRFLRSTSLDELPQFFNVLNGTMSMVGPRPPIPYEVELYEPWHLRRITETPPGVTGLWQVYGRNKTTFDEMVRLDLQYIRHRSIWLDVKIIFKTAAVLFNRKSGL